MQHDVAIKGDAEVDPRLEGVWRISEKTGDEIKTERDEDGIGIYGYVVFGKIDESTYRVVTMDKFEKDSAAVTKEMVATTRKHAGANNLLLTIPDDVKAKQGAE